jgi:uncharacterized repeat protein (TIGR01451 family)
LTVNKTASKKSAAEGGEIEHIINICNIGDVAVHNIEMRDVFGVAFIPVKERN